VFCVIVFSSFDATAQQLLDGFFTQIFINSVIAVLFVKKLSPIFGPSIIHSLPSFGVLCTEMGRNYGETKTACITTISRLPSHPRLVKFV